MRTSSNDSFAQRRQALEDEFFYQRDQQLVAELRNELRALEERHKLAHVSGIVDTQVLIDLAHSGVTGESLLAMRMVPMVTVAWSDHVVSAEERKAILSAAADDQILPGSAAYRLLDHWLHEKPRPEVVAAWREYTHELAKIAPPSVVQELRARTSRLCHRVALASSGFWSLGRIPADKQRLIDEFVDVWDQQST